MEEDMLDISFLVVHHNDENWWITPRNLRMKLSELFHPSSSSSSSSSTMSREELVLHVASFLREILAVHVPNEEINIRCLASQLISHYQLHFTTNNNVPTSRRPRTIHLHVTLYIDDDDDDDDDDVIMPCSAAILHRGDTFEGDEWIRDTVDSFGGSDDEASDISDDDIISSPRIEQFVDDDDQHETNTDDDALEESIYIELVEESMQQLFIARATEEAMASHKKPQMSKEEMKTSQCRICLENFDDGDHVSALPCGHCFHNNCIVEWLKRGHTCPLCRFQLANKE